MASGHVNRINRPNTWLHRPATRREVLTCQPGAVHTLHLADVDGGAVVSAFRSKGDCRIRDLRYANERSLVSGSGGRNTRLP